MRIFCIFLENACFLMISEYNELYLLDKFSVYYQLLDTYLRYPAIVGREGILEQVQLNSLCTIHQAKICRKFIILRG